MICIVWKPRCPRIMVFRLFRPDWDLPGLEWNRLNLQVDFEEVSNSSSGTQTCATNIPSRYCFRGVNLTGAFDMMCQALLDEADIVVGETPNVVFSIESTFYLQHKINPYDEHLFAGSSHPMKNELRRLLPYSPLGSRA